MKILTQLLKTKLEWDIAEILVRSSKLLAGLSLALGLSGCLLTSPYYNQEFSSHTQAIPLQAWTTNSDQSITFECAQASHGGLYPYYAPVWNPVATVSPDQPGVLDPLGNRIYSAARLQSLPGNCWRLDPANNVWYSAIRASQNGSTFNTFNKAGLECLGRENGKATSWFGWIGKNCNHTYSNTGNSIPYVIFYSKS